MKANRNDRQKNGASERNGKEKKEKKQHTMQSNV